ncbi:BTB domain-containing protein [Sergentomyia squamirostris]
MATSLLLQSNSEGEVWCKERGAVKDRLSYFVGNEFLSDMIFVVGTGEEKIRIPGHKFILSTCSWDFYNALYLLQLDNNEVPIQDAGYDAFLLFLKYCYTGEIQFSDTELNHAIVVLKLAYRFKMEHLIGICEDRICKFSKVIIVRSAFWWLKQCSFLPEESKVMRYILSTIAENFVLLLNYRSNMDVFKNFPLTTVKKIVFQKNLLCDEMQLFDILVKWANHNCQTKNIDPSPINLRIMLKEVFYMIRFPAMKCIWFLNILSEYPNLLIHKEISEISTKMSGKESICQNFLTIPREQDTRIIKSSIDFSCIEMNKVLPCFSQILKFEGTCRYASVTYKIGTAQNSKLNGFAVVVRKNQEFKVRRYTSIEWEKTEKTPEHFGDCIDDFKNNEFTRNCDFKIEKRYNINWEYDVVFFKLKNYQTDKGRQWYRFACEFETELPHAIPYPSFRGDNWINNICVNKENVSLIPYLCFQNE